MTQYQVEAPVAPRFETPGPTVIIDKIAAELELLANAMHERGYRFVEGPFVGPEQVRLDAMRVELQGLRSMAAGRRVLELDYSHNIPFNFDEAVRLEQERQRRAAIASNPIVPVGPSKLVRQGKTEAERQSGKAVRHEQNRDKAREANQGHVKGPSGGGGNKGGRK